MELKFDESTLLELKVDKDAEHNEYLLISSTDNVVSQEFENVIQIVDESGEEVSCSYGKFLEIFDDKGLEGFIM